MSREQITRAALELPVHERVELAEHLWRSVEEGLPGEIGEDEREAIESARRRDAELSSGTVAGRTHEQVMESVRRALG
jgi:putative addiction module component (TIGR02574 family)